MRRAFELARRAEGLTSPNPMVGAVVVSGDEIVGEGLHRRAGGAHAEIEALEAAGARARGATIYVTLEPCCVQGRTPPCTQALIDARVGRVVYAVRDPNPKVDGQGGKQLAAAGVEVEGGLRREEGERLIEAFTKLTRRGMPFVTAKFAMSLDGKIATRTGHSRWISSTESRRFSHHLRQISDAIVVGAGTVVADDPRLTTRLDCDEPRHPVRFVVDSSGRSPIESRLFSPELPGRTILATTSRIDPSYTSSLEARGVEIWALPENEQGRVDLQELLLAMGSGELMTALVEGGSSLLGSFFDLDLIDRALASVAPKVIGGADAPSPIGGLGVATMDDAKELTNIEITMRGGDVWIHADNPSSLGRQE